MIDLQKELFRKHKIGIILLAVMAASVIVVSVISFAVSIHKPYTLDEVEEARMAEKINTMGPNTFHPAPLGGGEPLSHPLLYSYTNAIFYKLFGAGEVSLRGYGIVFFMLSLALLILIIIDNTKKDDNRLIQAILLTVTLYIINPLLIQHSMLLNADNNISTFGILLYVYLFCKFEKRKDISFVKSRLILALVVAFNFLCKEVTPVFLMLSVVLYRLLNREFKKMFYDVFLNIGAGIALFWSIWYIYCVLTDTDVMGFIKFTIAKKTKKAIDLEFLWGQIKFFFVIWKWPFYWASAPFFILLFIYMFERIKYYIKERKVLVKDFVLISAATMFAPFMIVKPSIDMMKYQYPTYPLFIVVISWLIVDNLFMADNRNIFKEKKFDRAIVISFSLVVLSLFWYKSIGDYIIILWHELSFKFMASYYIPMIIGIAVLYFLLRPLKIFKVVLLGALIFTYGISMALNLNQTKDYTTAECWLNYGEMGLLDTVDYLKDRIDTRFMTYCRKDIAYYLNFRYKMNVDTEGVTDVFLTWKESDLDRFFTNQPIQYFVFDRISSIQRANKNIMNILSKYFIVEAQIGDFVVLRSKVSLLIAEREKEAKKNAKQKSD